MAGLPQFRVLGPFEARSPDGAAIDFSHRKVRALLVYLTIEHGRPQSREHLTTLLWARTGDDRAHRNLMELLARTGQRSEALRQYQECATALAQELGAEPGPETNQLVTEIRQGRFMPPGVGAAATMASRAAHDGEQPQLQPRVFATILVAEADGYEQSRDDDDGSGRILRRYLHVLAGRVGKHRGSIVQQAAGAVLAQFEESVDALTCAMSVQRGLSEANSDLDEASRVRCRIGVDRGSVTRDRNEIRGDAVNVAMRLEALAEPGGICISDAVRSSAEGRVCASFQFIGEHRARNVLNPVRAYSVAEQPGQITAVGAGTPRVPTAALALPGKPSLVKKPFRNMSADAEQDYFAEGLTKDISIALTKIPGLFLAADESPTARVSQGLSATEMGREFGVRYVLIGGVRRHGERVRVNAELIDAANGQCLWGERFDRELHDLFSIQDEITEEIVTAMDVKLVQGEAARFMRKALTNPVALEASYRGWYAL